MLVYVRYFVVGKAKAHAEIIGTKHVVEIGNGGELLGYQPAVEVVKTRDAVVFIINVGSHETNVRGQILKETAGIGTAENVDAQVRILVGQRIHYGYCHCNVADG